MEEATYAGKFTQSPASRDFTLTQTPTGPHSQVTPRGGLTQEMTSSLPSGATSHRDIDPRPSSPFPTSFRGQTSMPISAPTRPLTSEQGYFSGEPDRHSRRPSALPSESTPVMMSSLPRSRFQTRMTPPLLTGDVGGLKDSLSQMDLTHSLSGTKLSLAQDTFRSMMYPTPIQNGETDSTDSQVVSVLLTDVGNLTGDRTPLKTSQTLMPVSRDGTVGESSRLSPQTTRQQTTRQQTTLATRPGEDLRPSTAVLHLDTPTLSPGIESSLHSTMVFLDSKKPGPHSARVTQTFAPTLSGSSMALSLEVSTVVCSSSSESDPISPSAVQTPNTIASAATRLSLWPSLALCGASLGEESANGGGCTPPLNYTLLLQSKISMVSSIFSTLMLESQAEPYWTSLQSQSLSSKQAQTLRETSSVSLSQMSHDDTVAEMKDETDLHNFIPTVTLVNTLTASHMKTATPTLYASNTLFFLAPHGDLPETKKASFMVPTPPLSGHGGVRSPSVSQSRSTVLCFPGSTAYIAASELGEQIHSSSESSQIQITYFSQYSQYSTSSSSSSSSQLSLNLDSYFKPTILNPATTSTSSKFLHSL